jgi:hypothetical protein
VSKIFPNFEDLFLIPTELGVRVLRTKSGGLGRRGAERSVVEQEQKQIPPASLRDDKQKGKCKNKEQRQEKNNGKSRRIPWTTGPTTRVTAVVARKPKAKALG